MQKKYLIAVILVLLGTNLLTYGTARYWAMGEMKGRIYHNVEAALQKLRAGEQASGGDDEKIKRDFQILKTVGLSGPNYGGYNEVLAYWGGGAFFIIVGLVVTRYEPRKKGAI